MIRVHDEQDCAGANRPKADEALFLIVNRVQLGQTKRILKDQLSRLETDSMLAAI